MRAWYLSFVSSAGLWLGFATSAHAYTFPVQVTCAGSESTDDTSTIQAAINAAGPGGTVQFPAGKCYVSGNSSIVVNEVTLIGAGSPHDSEESRSNLGGVGTTILVGTSNTPPGSHTPFVLQHSFTIRGLTIEYPWTIIHSNGTPPSDPPLFADDGTNGSGDALFEDLTVVAPYIFWRQSQPAGQVAPTYGNIKFDNVNVYATFEVFEWDNIQEQVVLNNFLSNPSICGGGPDTTCYSTLKDWTATNGRWLHVVGTGNNTNRPAVGMATNNTVIASYGTGILIDSNGQLDESVFGPTTVWDDVPMILNVTPNGSITHTTFNGKSQNSRTDVVQPLFKLDNPQHPLTGALNNDANSLDLNGFNSEGSSREFLYLDATGTNAEFGSLNLSAAVIKNYCGATYSNAVYIAGKVDFVMIVGSQFNTSSTNCGAAFNISGGTAGKLVTDNLLYPSPPNPAPLSPPPPVN